MATVPPAAYLPTEDPQLVESTELASAGWYDDGQHGGVVSALLAGAIEEVPTLAPMQVARLTVELFRRVPVAPLRVTTRVLREGKRIQLVEASAATEEAEVARAVGLRLRVAELDLPPEALPDPTIPTHPDLLESPDTSRWGVGAEGRVMFHRHAIDIREAEGSWYQTGPAAVWLRITRPLVAGRQPSPLQRAVVTADFGNGVSRLLHTRDWVFMNADLTVHLFRMPVGEWVALRAESWYHGSGRGVAASMLYDTAGPIGRGTQTLFLDRRSD